jgi:nicotinate phosphoribosyltransferase
VSESRAKVPNPGAKDVWRLYDDRKTATADVVAARGEDVRASDPLWLYHPTRESSRRTLTQAAISEAEPLLVDVMRDGMRVALHESIEDMRQRREADLARLDPGVRRLINPHVYHVSLTEKMWDQKRRLIAEAQSNG